MLLPYATDNLPNRRMVATLALLTANTVIAAVLLLGAADGRWRLTAVLDVVGIVPGRFRPYTLFTYMFVHESFGHLLLNLFFLWVFGAGVEAALGTARFLGLYVLSGVVGGFLQWLVSVTLLPTTIGVPIVGSSAACSGLIGLYAVRYYRANISFIGLWFRPHVVAVISAFLAYEIGAGLWSVSQGAVETGAAHWAHIGGFVFGLSCAQLLHLDSEGQRAYLAQDATRAMERSVPGAAIRRWETLLSREPNNTDARRELARAWLQLGDEEQAAAQYGQSVHQLLAASDRTQATDFYAEMRNHHLADQKLTAAELYIVGNVLEEREEFEAAAETLLKVSDQSPFTPEGETAMLKVISLYVHRLNRRADARTLLATFRQRHPTTAWRGLADDLERDAQ